ncbi:MAG: amidohydrolase family protein [Deltaproteobacteria bacterium]|nr:amidohydrolase family protein [Deltaproteobacteria bacterium]
MIDAHTHLFPDEVRRDRSSFCRRDEGFRLLYESERARLAGPEELLSAMEQDGVEQSVICGFPWRDPGLCREGNDYLLHCSRRFSGRMIPFASLPASSPALARRELERSLSLGLRGIGEMAFYGRGMAARQARGLVSVLGGLAGEGVPVLLHVSEPVGHEYPGKVPDGLEPVYRLLTALPEVTFILAHWGGGLFFYELMPEVARAARNAFYDTAASPFLFDPRIYRLALTIVGPERILFGSDYPLLRPRRYFEELARTRIPALLQKRIKGRNARVLLGGESSGVRRPGEV